MIKKILNSAISFVFPNMCLSCGRIIDEDKRLCDSCQNNLTVIPADKRCLKCGLSKPDCDCVRHIYYFEGALSVFHNSNTARNIVYKYKFANKKHYREYIADKMIRIIKEEYSDIKFDVIVPVPTSLKSFVSRGYDHIFLLSENISEKLRIPISKDIIGCKPFGKPQHTNDYSNRFPNAREKYFVKNKTDAKTVLLVDDVKTTGATLDSCARCLLFAGAHTVYCVTALGGTLKKKVIKKL